MMIEHLDTQRKISLTGSPSEFKAIGLALNYALDNANFSETERHAVNTFFLAL